MDVSKQTQEKINQISLIEENLRNVFAKKHAYQSEQLEINNALKELEKAEGQVYKIAGPVMIISKKEDLQVDLKEKKELTEVKLQSVENQETKLKEKAQSLQEEVLKEMEGKK